MGTMSRDEKQLNCIYVSDSDFGKQIDGYLKSSKKNILFKDIKDKTVSETQWHEILDAIDAEVKDLLDFSLIDNLDKNSSFSSSDYIKIIENNPEAFRGAIIINGDNTSHVTAATQVLEYFDVDSAGLEKTFNSEDIVTKQTTDKDSFI